MKLKEIINLPENQMQKALDELTRSMRLTDMPKQAITAQPLSDAQIKRMISTWPLSFETYTPHHELMLKAAKRFVYDVLSDNRARWITFLGPSGIGKTLLLKQCYRFLAKNWSKLRISDERFKTPQIAHIIPAEDLTDYKAPRDYAKYDLIYIEDIGSGSGLDKGAGSVLRSRIAELLQLRTNKWTMLDSNLSRSSISTELDGRIASRLKRDGSSLIEMPNTTPDFNA